MLEGGVGARFAELADRLADLSRLEDDTASSPQRILRAAVELAAAAAPAASGASIALWHRVPGRPGWEPDVRVASLPDTARLDDVELSAGDGPALTAIAGAGERGPAPVAEAGPDRPEPVDAPDLIADPRWPAYTAAAVTAGVRAVRAIARPVPGGRLTLTLHSVRAGSFEPADTAVAVLVLAQSATALGNAERYAAARRDAHQLAEAMRGRAAIEQAKGVLLAEIGGDPDAAFAELRRRSQAENVRLVDVAARVVAAAARGGIPGR